MTKTILIFGGGDNQLTLIKAARELGIMSVVIDPNNSAPGKDIADAFEVVESDDFDNTKEIALKYKVDGIVTSQMENPLKLMANALSLSQSILLMCFSTISLSLKEHTMPQLSHLAQPRLRPFL